MGAEFANSTDEEKIKIIEADQVKKAKQAEEVISSVEKAVSTVDSGGGRPVKLLTAKECRDCSDKAYAVMLAFASNATEGETIAAVVGLVYRKLYELEQELKNHPEFD